MSASSFLLSTYLIWIWDSKLILSNNPSRATLWVLETCLIVGLRSYFNYHPDHSFVVQLRLILRRMCVCEYIIHIIHLLNLLFSFDMLGLGFGIKNCPSFLVPCMFGLDIVLIERSTSITMSQSSRAGSPHIRNPASREMISDSVELCETELRFLHIQLTGTNVLLPKIHKTTPEVDLESSISPAESESWNKPTLQCCAVFPTWQYCR